MNKIVCVALALGACSAVMAQSSTLHVEMAGVKSSAELSQKMDLAARNFARVAASLTRHAREVRHQTSAFGFTTPFSLPTRIVLTKNGRALANRLTPKPPSNALTLTFDAPGTARAFPPGYQVQLQTAFDTAISTINAVFGAPSANGTVFVRNYDADIDDRDAVAGGYYTPDNGSGQPEIRFPVYQNQEAAYVNFIHTVLLAYLGQDTYAWDAFEEGLVRAAAMKIVRTAGAVPAGLDPAQIENVLASTYDVGSYYDWYNQRALGGPVFIAPNLKTTSLPPGGSTGGLYLLRYQMAGSAWQKMLIEYPGFISQLNAALYATPSLGSDISGLANQCQSIMNTLAGNGSATIEGQSFSNWALRQFILETKLTAGNKLLVEPVAISSGLSGTDFGVFSVQADYFQTLANGNETLLSGTCFPVFWDPNFSRVFPTAQENQMDIAGGYGSVTPNFPDLFSGQPYRMTVDLPVLDSNARAFLPAGAIATASNPTPNNFFGTVENVILQTGDTLNVQISWPSSNVPPIPVTNGAFGVNISDPLFDAARTVTIQVVLTHNASPSTVLTRVVDKGVGPLAVDLRNNAEGPYAFGTLPAGISMMGFPIDPFESYAPDIFNVSASQLLLARYNQTRTQYDLFPDTEAPTIGHGYFVRLNTAQPGFTVSGRVNPNTPGMVALKPGWNMITSPLPESVPTTSIKVIRSTSFPTDYALSAGTDIGIDFFKFVPGSNDPGSGVPETGSLVPASTFDPGVGYFVRVIAPEGVSMLFFPSSPPLPPFIKTAATQTRPSDGWRVRFDLQSSDSTVSAYIGGSRNASIKFDPKLDSAMPPGIGGFQLTVNDGQPLFRDIRSLTPNQTFTFKMDGLVRGQTYWLNPVVEAGNPTKYLIVPQKGERQNLQITKPYRFVATGTRQTVKITVRQAD